MKARIADWEASNRAAAPPWIARAGKARTAAWGGIARWLIPTLIVLAPLPFGAVQPWSFLLLEAAIALSFGLALAGARRAGRSALLPFAGWAGLLVLLHLLQLLPLPGPLAEALSPQSHYLHQALRAEPLPGGGETVSLSPAATLESLFWFLACVLAFHLPRLLPDRGRPREGRGGLESLRNVLWALTLSGVLQAAYGLAEHLLQWNRIFGYERRHLMTGAAGTFINQNHFGSYLCLCLFAALGLLFSARAGRPGSGPAPPPGRTAARPAPGLEFRAPRSPGLRKAGGGGGFAAPLLAAAVLLVGVALLFSRSGGALVAAAAGLLAYLFFHFRQRRRLAPGRGGGGREAAALALLLLLAVLVAAVWLRPGLSGGPLAEDTFGSLGNRLTLWRQSLSIARDFPLLGSGGGTYHQLMPHYWNRNPVHAHNEYLEVLCDLGPLGLLAAVAVIVAFGRRWWRTAGVLLGAGGAAARSLPLFFAAGSALVALLVHALVDFPLRIPALALTASLLAGALWRGIVEIEESVRPREQG